MPTLTATAATRVASKAKPLTEKNIVVWTFRRCPYAMRARMAIDVAGLDVEFREIVLRDKPPAMLECSPKGTVPICVLSDQRVLDESLDIMHWALHQHDPESWLAMNDGESEDIDRWICSSDRFKFSLDRYKYENRYPDLDREAVLEDCRQFLARIDSQVEDEQALVAQRTTLADVAIFPFVRQFHHVDRSRIPTWGFHALERWLRQFTESERFARVMVKRPLWPASPERD